MTATCIDLCVVRALSCHHHILTLSFTLSRTIQKNSSRRTLSSTASTLATRFGSEALNTSSDGRMSCASASGLVSSTKLSAVQGLAASHLEMSDAAAFVNERGSEEG
ncbi:hypothetical protein Vafri_3233, partial [Volvox africanus]